MDWAVAVEALVPLELTQLALEVLVAQEFHLL
jgi:hypothetical protein